jgi:beta-carotene hydroxylase
MQHLLRRKSDWLLLAYQAAVYGLFALLFLVFRNAPLWCKLALYPVAALLTQKYESPLHYATHAPVFRAKIGNTVHRLSWFIFPLPAVLYRREHFHHHRHDNLGPDKTTTVDASGRRHVSVLVYVCRNIASTRGFWNRLDRAEQREAALHVALCVALAAILFSIDPVTTLVFWLPVSWVIAPAMNALFCYFGHVPGNPHSKYLASTYAPVERPWQRALCWLDFHNAAFHLTHHLFPGVHWSELERVQKALEGEYQRRGSPRSLAFNSMILLNPLALLATVWRVNRARDATPIASLPPARVREDLAHLRRMRSMTRARTRTPAETVLDSRAP